MGYNVRCFAERPDIEWIDFQIKPGKLVIGFNDSTSRTYNYQLEE